MDILVIIGVLIVIVGFTIEHDMEKSRQERKKQARKLEDSEKAVREAKEAYYNDQ